MQSGTVAIKKDPQVEKMMFSFKNTRACSQVVREAEFRQPEGKCTLVLLNVNKVSAGCV